MGGNSLLNKLKNWISIDNKSDPEFTKINSKWIMNLNINGKTIKFLEDNIQEKNLIDLGYGDQFQIP